MARKYSALTNAVVRDATAKHPKAPTLYSDGGGLYLQITPTGVKSWIFRYSLVSRPVIFWH
nr:Arm DNA-binding domain-containing protein [Acidovorax sp. SUPP3334]